MPRDDLIQYRRGTHAQWETANPVLAEGEVGYTTDAPHTLKIGDGWATWIALPVYLSNESTGGGGTGPVGPTGPTVYSSDFSPIEWRWAIPDGAYALALQARAKGSNDPWGLVNYPSTVLTTDALNTALEHLYTDGEGGGFRFIRTGDNSENFELQSNLPDGEWRTVQTFPVAGGGGSALPIVYATSNPDDGTGGEFVLNDRIKLVAKTSIYGSGGSYLDFYGKIHIGTPEESWVYMGEVFVNDAGKISWDLEGGVYVSGDINTNELLVQGPTRFIADIPTIREASTDNPIASRKYVDDRMPPPSENAPGLLARTLDADNGEPIGGLQINNPNDPKSLGWKISVDNDNHLQFYYWISTATGDEPATEDNGYWSYAVSMSAPFNEQFNYAQPTFWEPPMGFVNDVNFVKTPTIDGPNNDKIPLATEQYVAEHGQRVFAGNDYDGTSGIVIKDDSRPSSDVNLINDGGFFTMLSKVVDYVTGEPVAGYSEENPWVDHIYFFPLTRHDNGDGTAGALTGGQIQIYTYNDQPGRSGFSVNGKDVVLKGVIPTNVSDADQVPFSQGTYEMTDRQCTHLPVFEDVLPDQSGFRQYTVWITTTPATVGEGVSQYARCDQNPQIFVRSYYTKVTDLGAGNGYSYASQWSPWVQINKAP